MYIANYKAHLESKNFKISKANDKKVHRAIKRTMRGNRAIKRTLRGNRAIKRTVRSNKYIMSRNNLLCKADEKALLHIFLPEEVYCTLVYSPRASYVPVFLLELCEPYPVFNLRREGNTS